MDLNSKSIGLAGGSKVLLMQVIKFLEEQNIPNQLLEQAQAQS
jgi:hypothetical protein